MPDFVVGFMRESLTDRILLIRKMHKPVWQIGRLNGAGGKIELCQSDPECPNRLMGAETPLQAMIREWREEIGHDHTDWRLIASIADKREAHLFGGQAPVVHFFAATVRWLPKDHGSTDAGDLIETIRLEQAATCRELLSQLRWVIPKAYEDPDSLAVVSA